MRNMKYVYTMQEIWWKMMKIIVWAFKVYFSTFTRFRDTSQKFSDMRMSIEFLHQSKFGHQVLPVRLRSVICKTITQQLLTLQTTAVAELKRMSVDVLLLNRIKLQISLLTLSSVLLGD